MGHLQNLPYVRKESKFREMDLYIVSSLTTGILS